MADIAHVLPASLVPNPNTSIGMVRPGMSSLNYKTGRTLSRDFGSHHLKTYTISPKIFASDSTLLNEFEAFWNNINGGEDEAYILEPYSHVHRMVPCGPITDGTRTTYTTNIVGASDLTVFVDGVPQETSAYTVHTAANLLTDAQAAPSNAGDFADVNGTDSVATGIAADGLTSLKFTPTGGSATTVTTETKTVVDASTEYTGVIAHLSTASTPPNYRARLAWYTGASAYISVSDSADTPISAGAWHVLSVTATSPATAGLATAGNRCSDTSTDPYYVDCFALCPGDYDRWHLPSQAPSVIEFDTAPAAGSRVYISATGKRLTRCAFELDASWTAGQNDNLTMKAIRATEVLEY